MIKISAALTAISALSLSVPAHAWGPTGHRVTAQIAQDNISGRTRAEIVEILGHEELPEASTWPDEERSNPALFWQETAGPFHYVTLPTGQEVGSIIHPAEGDALTALEGFTAVLRDDAASADDRALALRFVVHIVSDLHMPLHSGRGTDRGGNDFIVDWFGKETNLHWVWDEGMILRQQLSYSEYADRLERHMTAEEVLAWWEPAPGNWVAESVALRERIYPQTGPSAGPYGGPDAEPVPGLGTEEFPVALQYRYHWTWIQSAEERLAQSGIRLAAYLDMVFAEE